MITLICPALVHRIQLSCVARHTHTQTWKPHINCTIYGNGLRLRTLRQWFTGIDPPRGLWLWLPDAFLSINNLEMQCKSKASQVQSVLAKVSSPSGIQGKGADPSYLTDIYPAAQQRQVSLRSAARAALHGYLFVDFEIWFYGFSFRLTLRWFSIGLPLQFPGILFLFSFLIINAQTSELAWTCPPSHSAQWAIGESLRHKFITHQPQKIYWWDLFYGV